MRRPGARLLDAGVREAREKLRQEEMFARYRPDARGRLDILRAHVDRLEKIRDQVDRGMARRARMGAADPCWDEIGEAVRLYEAACKDLGDPRLCCLLRRREHLLRSALAQAGVCPAGPDDGHSRWANLECDRAGLPGIGDADERRDLGMGTAAQRRPLKAPRWAAKRPLEAPRWAAKRPLEAPRCDATTRAGQRCTRSACRGRYCAQHGRGRQ